MPKSPLTRDKCRMSYAMYSIYLPTHQGSRGLSSLWKLLTILEMRAREAAAGWTFGERTEREEDRQTCRQAGRLKDI